MRKKEVVVCLEHRFYRVGDDVYTALSFPYAYWEEYLGYFDHVTVVARVKKVSDVEDGFVKASGVKVSFSDVPYYKGLKSFLMMLPFLLFRMAQVVVRGNHFLLRSGNVSNLAFIYIFILRKRYLREYPGNIKDGIVGLMGGSLLYRMIAAFSDHFARLQGRFSKANSFVSDYCRLLYGSKKPSFVFSSFNSDEISVAKESYGDVGRGFLSLVSVGRLEKEKGHYTLLKAMAEMKVEGEKVSLKLIGDGSDRGRLEAYSRDNAIDVAFLGAITERSDLFSVVLSADAFVIPSLTEGMPRALLEAMAMGMPCVGSKVGGIPEVLDSSAMCPPGDAKSLGFKLMELKDESLRKQCGERNYRFISDNYSNGVMKKKRHEFWGMLYE